MKLLMREQQVNLHAAPHAVHLECDVCKKTTTFRVTAGELDIENPPEDAPLTVGPDVIKFLSTPKCLTSDLARLMAGGLGNVTIDNREFRRPVDNMPKVRAAADAIGLKFLPQESEDSPDAFHVECEARIVKGLGVPNNIIKDDPHPNEKSD